MGEAIALYHRIMRRENFELEVSKPVFIYTELLVGKDGEVLANTPIWMDTRAKDICDEFNEKCIKLGYNNYPVVNKKGKCVIWNC